MILTKQQFADFEKRYPVFHGRKQIGFLVPVGPVGEYTIYTYNDNALANMTEMLVRITSK